MVKLKLISDEKFRRKFVRAMLQLGSLSAAERKFDIPDGLIETEMSEDQEFEELMVRSVENEFSRLQRIEGKCRLNLALQTLANQLKTLDGGENIDQVIKTASALIRAQQELLKYEAPKESDLERIWKDLTEGGDERKRDTSFISQDE